LVLITLAKVFIESFQQINFKTPMTLYPLKFKPITQYRIWGGNKLNAFVPEDLRMDNLGEIWSISGVEGNISVVENGELIGKNLKEIISEFKERIVGKKVWGKFGTDFPILIKFIDAAERLSVQVHPDDRQAKELHDSFGKSEMWYIMGADPDSELIIGFKEGVGVEDYKKHLEDETLEEILNRIKVQKGDAVYIPARRVHAIGSGITLAEIQQTSDVTYRIYDYNRIDKNGQKRELHTDLALSAIDFETVGEVKTNCKKVENQFNPLIESVYFETGIFSGNKEISFCDNDQMRIYICTSGSAEFISDGNSTVLNPYQSLLLPAEISDYQIRPTAEVSLLEVMIP